MKIISWNVNGLRACLNKDFEEFFYNEDADIFCIQETKLQEEQNPFHPTGYFEYIYSAQKKGYSGTLIYSKVEPISVKYGIDDEEYDNEGRTITAEYNDFYLVNCYVPNSKRELERLDSRMNFEDIMKKLEQIANELEKGNLNLDDSVKKFEEGIKLSKMCNEILEKAEKKITMLIRDGDDVKEEKFEATE